MSTTPGRESSGRAPHAVGLGVRPELWPWLLEHADEVDAVEVMADDLLHLSPRRAKESLKPLTDRGIELVVHGVNLSVASADGPSHTYLRRVGKLLDALGVDTFSEHCSFHRHGDLSVGQFLPVPFTRRWVELVARNIRAVQALLGRRLLIENIAYLTAHPRTGIGEAAFLTALCERADCGLLLDLENVRVNAANHGYAPVDLLAALPLERVGQLHLAGGHVTRDGVYVDSHNARTGDQVLALLGAVSAAISPECVVIVERDKKFPGSWAPLSAELAEVRQRLQAPNDLLTQAAAFVPSNPQTTVDDEGLSPELFQDSWLAYFQNTGHADEHADDAHIASIPYRFRQSFAQVLDTKRQDKLVTTIPGTWRVLEKLGIQRDSLDQWYAVQPRQDLSRAEEAAGFCALVAANETLPEALRALADHESTVAALSARPDSAWRPRWLPQRIRRRARFDPEALDAVAQGAPLPAPLGRTVDVVYTRRQDGVWVTLA